MASLINKITKNVVLPLVFAVGVGGNAFGQEIKENKTNLNMIVIYYDDDWNFGRLDETAMELKDSLKKSYSEQFVNLEIYATNKILNYKSDEDSAKFRKNAKTLIDSLFTNFAKRNGKIDIAILGFHSDSQESKIFKPIIRRRNLTRKQLDAYINSANLKNDKNYIYYGDWENGGKLKYTFCEKRKDIILTSKELKEIAEKNNLSKDIFSKNGKVLYLGCSAGKGDESIAETLSRVYNVEVEAPTIDYFGHLLWDEKTKSIILARNQKEINPLEIRIFNPKQK